MDAGRLANHGPCYIELNKLIEKRISYNSIVANATVGLELALRARFKSGSKIGLPTFTFKATYLAVINAGMIPIIIPVKEDTWMPHEGLFHECDGVIIVAPFGYSIDFSIWDNLNIPVIFDLAAGWGLDYRGPNIAVYSMHATKNFCVGEGAIIVSQDYNVINEISRLSNFGHTNAKIPEISCAMALAILEEGIKYPEYHYDFDRPCVLSKEFASLFVVRVRPECIYHVLNNGIFECRRYYYPLIEYIHGTPLYVPGFRNTHYSENHPISSLVAIPRDVTKDEAEEIGHIVKKFLIDP